MANSARRRASSSTMMWPPISSRASAVVAPKGGIGPLATLASGPYGQRRAFSDTKIAYKSVENASTVGHASDEHCPEESEICLAA
jgi:hypothetical protein